MRLEHDNGNPLPIRDGYFNSIKVRLELTIDTLGNLKAEFQFHKGAIRTVLGYLLLVLMLYFNSIKVRLELAPQRAFHSNYLFQFHKGAIRTR